MKTLPYFCLIIATIVGAYFIFFRHGDARNLPISGPPSSEARLARIDQSVVVKIVIREDGTVSGALVFPSGTHADAMRGLPAAEALVEFFVDAKGKPTNIRVVRATTEEFGKKAIEGIKKISFHEGYHNQKLTVPVSRYERSG